MVILLVLLVLFTTSINKYEDSKVCELPYSSRCTLVINKVTKIVYLEVEHDCEKMGVMVKI